MRINQIIEKYYQSMVFLSKYITGQQLEKFEYIFKLDENFYSLSFKRTLYLCSTLNKLINISLCNSKQQVFSLFVTLNIFLYLPNLNTVLLGLMIQYWRNALLNNIENWNVNFLPMHFNLNPTPCLLLAVSQKSLL